jgi:hypothetical protein
MELGYELVKEQLFFRRELKERVYWFIKLRWIAVGAALVGTWAASLFGLDLPLLPLTLILLAIILYNCVFLIIGKNLEAFRPDEVQPFNLFAHVQIALDLLALCFVIYFTGGTVSPLLIFVIFHIILAGILLSPFSCFAYAILVILALGGLIFLQESGILPAHGLVFRGLLLADGGEGLYPLILFLRLAVAILVTAFLVTTVKVSLRTKGREILHVSRELDFSNAKLTALYDMVKEMGTCSDLQVLMDSATRLAAKIMGVRACSIKLLDEQGQTLRFASAHGLSEDYVSKGSIQIDKSPINRRIIEGSLYAIRSIDEKDYFQYPEDIRKEGIASMLCLPLRVETMILGVFCVYSGESYHFGDRDVTFFSLMTDLTAMAIENLKSEATKSWFMKKAAHQIRSPMNAIYSMLKLIRNGYLGPVEPRQDETLGRCERRIEILGDLVNDLLKLGEGRGEVVKKAVHPVDVSKALGQVIPLYQSRATDKGVEMEFRIQEPLPDILGDEELLDELFTNLISNAIKYTPKGGKVKVSLSKEGRVWIRLEVSDTGIGIPEGDIPRLFSEFFRAENAKAFEEQGTGLGLVIVKEVLDRLRGSIRVQSKLGQGTTFTCLIPTILQP